MITQLKNFFLKSYFLALVLSVVVIAFLPNLFNKYKIELVDSGMINEIEKKSTIYSYDLDHDGFSEKVYSFEYEGKHSLQVITHDGGIVDQWNTGGIIAGRGERLVCGDYDKDSYDEVYTFYQRNDSVFLYCFEPKDTTSPIWITNKFICSLSNKYAKPDYSILNILFNDTNGDGKEELLFVINSGKSKFPRGITIYDLTNDTIIGSEEYGSTLNYGINLSDFDGDGKMEISGSTSAAGQIADSLGYKYNDYSAWLMVFNHELKLTFNPIEFPGFRSIIYTLPISLSDSKFIVGYYNHRGPLDNYPKLMLVDNTGKIVKEYDFPKSSKIQRWLDVFEKDGEIHIHVIEESGIINIFNLQLELIEKVNLNHTIGRNYNKVDLDMDGEYEFIFNTENKTIVITRNDFSEPVSFTLDFFPGPLSLLVANGNDNPSLFIYRDSEFLSIQYSRNPLASLRFLIYLSIYLSFWLFIIAIQKLQLIQIQKKERIRNQIVNLQLKSFKNQMDPHFTFNVFNTMAHKIQKESPESYAAFMEFSNLIRKSLLSSDSITRSIDDELSQLKSYLELEKLRFPDKVFYSIIVDEDVNQQMHIPKMILQTYVENAIKHGIRHKMDSGTVSVSIKKKVNNLSFEIIDDGVGRDKAKQYAGDSTGFGLKIMDNYFRLFNEYNVSKIKHEIIDLYDEKKIAIGTEVRILIPLNFSYKLNKHTLK